MTKVYYSSIFKRSFKRRISGNPGKESRFQEEVEAFATNPFTPKLRTHKLAGELEGRWSFNAGYDLRIVFSFTDDGDAVLLDIGTHREVY